MDYKLFDAMLLLMIDKRFGRLLDKSGFLMATVCHPKFKPATSGDFYLNYSYINVNSIDHLY